MTLLARFSHGIDCKLSPACFYFFCRKDPSGARDIIDFAQQRLGENVALAAVVLT